MSTNSASPNFLLLIADDLGKDLISITGSGTGRSMQVRTKAKDNTGPNANVIGYHVGNMPNVSRLLRNGVYFDQAWAQPACSPTRASIYSGVHPWRNGVGSPMGNPVLDTTISLTTLPELLPSAYKSGLFGKWHLGNNRDTSPLEHGWDKHVGTFDGVVPDYRQWPLLDSDGVYDEDLAPYSTEYVTTVTVREAADWINALDSDTPWFATMAFHAPHSPFHTPPSGTTGITSIPAGANTDTNDFKFNLMTQSLDHHIGGLLGTASSGGIPPMTEFDFAAIPQDQLQNTIIIFIGDNGSDSRVAIEEPKTYEYEGSVAVPMIIADGASVMAEFNSTNDSPRFLHPRRVGWTSTGMTHVIDLYATLAHFADPTDGTMPARTDSVDLGPLLTRPLMIRHKTPGKPKVPVNPGSGGLPGTKVPDLPDFEPAPTEVRNFNFAQWYSSDTERASIRNAEYKLNYEYDPATDSHTYALYRFEEGIIPDREDATGTPAENLWDAAINRTDNFARENLDLLLDELLADYRRNQNDQFHDPRPFPAA
ncbi:MAG: sulfatase-like hydrolase/transferase [Burkholderiales bacterium]|nr:sulfatase-like hydrolase/transferase [Nitrosomonas sp.]MCP5274391.1 sulfatase-like hydrolase/transferase [Burkholderiales bacterium]